jgi:hypothetical protein
LIIPNCLLWPDSIVVLDMRGETYEGDGRLSVEILPRSAVLAGGRRKGRDGML